MSCAFFPKEQSVVPSPGGKGRGQQRTTALCIPPARGRHLPSPVRVTRHSRGSSLLEVLLASGLFLFLLFTLLQFYGSFRGHMTQAQRNQIAAQGESWLQQNLSFHVRQAGYGALSSNGSNLFAQSELSAIQICPFGIADERSSSVVCSNGLTPDPVLILRYFADADNATTTSTGRVKDCLGNGVPPGDMLELRYRVKTSPSTNRRELYCNGNGGVSSGQRWLAMQPYIEKVEDWRLKLSWDSDNDGYADTLSATAPAPQARPLGLEVCLVMTTDTTGGAAATAWQDCDGVLQRSPHLHHLSRFFIALRQ